MSTATGTADARIGLIIVSYNSAKYIVRCLEAVGAQVRRPNRVIIVDNASTDGTVDVARTASARLNVSVEIVASAENAGFAAANNWAVERLDDCDLIATLNPDAFPDPTWLAALVAAASDHQDAASFASLLLTFGGPNRVDGSGDVYHASGLAWRYAHGLEADAVPGLREPRAVFSACAAAALYRRSDWLAAGGLDEHFFCYAEDVDLGFRLQLLGKSCRYVPTAVAQHVGSYASGVDAPFAVYHGHRNLEWTFVKNMPRALMFRFLLPHVAGSIAAIVWYSVHGRAISVLRAKLDALLGLPRVLRQRRSIQRNRVASDTALLTVIDRSPLRERFRARARRATSKAKYVER